MEYIRKTIDSSSLAGIFDLPASLRNRNVEVIILPSEIDRKTEHHKSTKGRLRKCANPALIPMEKDAWANAVEEKHANC